MFEGSEAWNCSPCLVVHGSIREAGRMRCLVVLLVNGFGGECLPFVWEMPLVKLQSILWPLFVALAACCPSLVQVRCVFSGLFPIKLEFRRSDIRPRVLRVLSLAKQRCRARLRRGHLLDENRGRRSDR